jgi:hypothetical protein
MPDVQVRIAVAVGPDGNWNATGWTDAGDTAMDLAVEMVGRRRGPLLAHRHAAGSRGRGSSSQGGGSTVTRYRRSQQELVCIPRETLVRLAWIIGECSASAKALAELDRREALGEQVMCFQDGEYFVVAPVPEAQTVKAEVQQQRSET